MSSVVIASPLIFLPSFALFFFLRDCRSFPMREGNFLFRFIGAVVSPFEVLKLFMEHLYSFLSLLKIFQLLSRKGIWSMVFSIKDFSLDVDE